jgi:hypothetical protein
MKQAALHEVCPQPPVVVAVLRVCRKSNWLKPVLARLVETLEKVGEVVDGGLNKLVCVGVDRVDPDCISWQKGFLNKFQDAAKIEVDRYRLGP